ncbi:hypothetical protein MTBBW1_850035 [Desulfamplus magnetovallimortis]|uniref:Uncharacterized protein n=1 Tax=Desulfamplus magnetovallimortis TaxID=1246637 RepID=A0A1W1HKK6_9BACT|nr:hypothetical protein MTBBW1_850035 [Desulfamplus magnetovallimortis]
MIQTVFNPGNLDSDSFDKAYKIIGVPLVPGDICEVDDTMISVMRG